MGFIFSDRGESKDERSLIETQQSLCQGGFTSPIQREQLANSTESQGTGVDIYKDLNQRESNSSSLIVGWLLDRIQTEPTPPPIPTTTDITFQLRVFLPPHKLHWRPVISLLQNPLNPQSRYNHRGLNTSVNPSRRIINHLLEETLSPRHRRGRGCDMKRQEWSKG